MVFNILHVSKIVILDCGSTLTESSGTIVNPSYPDTLPGPVECIWNIEGKVGEVISLDMKQFRLGYKGGCGRADLEVRDSISEPIIGTYCGASTPRFIRSHSNRMYLRYFSGGALRGERFKIEYVRGICLILILVVFCFYIISYMPLFFVVVDNYVVLTDWFLMINFA